MTCDGEAHATARPADDARQRARRSAVSVQTLACWIKVKNPNAPATLRVIESSKPLISPTLCQAQFEKIR
jgi:hypothetical protein